MKLFVCIATFNRQEYLAQLVTAIDKQQKPANCNLIISISDNDPQGSSEAVVNSLKKQVAYPIRYSIESRKGISQNRNNSVRMVDKDADFVVFVDDDEVPADNWLITLLDVQQQTGAEVVSGFSLPHFVSPPPTWVVKGNFFLRPLYATLKSGDTLSPRNVMTNTLLVSYPALRQLNGPFDDQYGLTGGEDNDLGRRLGANKSRMVWAPKAVVWEWIPESRATLNWILKRAFRTANTLSLLEKNASFLQKTKILLFGIGRLMYCVALLIPAFFISLGVGLHPLVHVLRIGFRGVGVIAGLVGVAYQEYKSSNTVSSPNLITNLSK